ncbi:hypothetical protein BJX65DRAFT_307710 [Aspergillus insuetus]
MAPITQLPALTTLIFFLLSRTSLARDCFLMSGKNASTSHQPCTPSLSASDHSACCATATDTCLESGLCIASTGLIYESGCTDPTWESDACPHVCPDVSTNWRGSASGNWTVGEERDYWQVMVCTAGVVCCRASSGDPDCCGDDEGLVELMPGAPVLAAQEGGDDEGTRTVTRTVTATEMVTGVETGTTSGDSDNKGAPTAVDGSDSGSLSAEGTCADCTKRETTVGAAVGASLGAALIGALGAVWFLLQRQKKLAATLGQYQAAGTQPPASSVASTGPLNRNTAFRPFAELDAERKYELATESSISPS